MMESLDVSLERHLRGQVSSQAERGTEWLVPSALRGVRQQLQGAGGNSLKELEWKW